VLRGGGGGFSENDLSFWKNVV